MYETGGLFAPIIFALQGNYSKQLTPWQAEIVNPMFDMYFLLEQFEFDVFKGNRKGWHLQRLPADFRRDKNDL